MIISQKGPLGALQFKIVQIYEVDPKWLYAECLILYQGIVIGTYLVGERDTYFPPLEELKLFVRWRILKLFLSKKIWENIWNKKRVRCLVQNYMKKFYYPKLVNIKAEIVKDSRKTAQYLLEEDVVVRNFVTILQKELSENR
jgi:hypothetical protein